MGKKKYIKNMHGGAEPLIYKQQSFDDGVMQFLQEHLLLPVKHLNPEIFYIRVYYDERSEIAENSNKNIVIEYHLRNETMQLFYIDAEKTLMAYYAYNHANPTQLERRCLTDILSGSAFEPMFIEVA